MTKPAFITCPKRKPYKDPHLLKMARGKKCLLRVSGVCNNNPETTVACHSNSYIHGKGKSQKAHDFYTVWGCSSCHDWLDQGSASREEKDRVFDAAMQYQIEELDNISFDHFDKERKTAEKAVEAFKDWVTENTRLFEPGDWQLGWVR